MNKIAIIVLVIGLSACSSSPEDQLKDCVINANLMMIEGMRDALKKQGKKMPQEFLDRQDKAMADVRAMTWEQMLNQKGAGPARHCLKLQKENPEKFNEILNY